MQKNQKKKLWIGIVTGLVIGMVTLVALFIILALLIMFGGPADVTTKLSTYEEKISQQDTIRTGLITFPEQIPESAQDTDFYFYYQDTWNVPTLEVFLQCTYDAKDYRAEIRRLEGTQKQYGSTIRTLLRDEEGRFPYPAYIAMDGHSNSFEYAMLTGERQITYIYTSQKKSEDLKKISAEYLPSDFDKTLEVLSQMEGYSIYLKSVDMEDGEVSGWSCDYTRDRSVEVLDYYVEFIDYNDFSVCVCLDEEDREIIKNCAFSYYDNHHDSMYGFPDEIVYSELEGYLFKSLELNEDKTKAIVTYYDGDVEKTMEYDIPEV